MKDLEKGLSPSNSKASRDLSFSGWVENDENDSSVDKLIPQFEHKIKFGEDFTSVHQRKKILEEINDFSSVSDGQNNKSCNLNVENSSPTMGISDSVVSCCGNASVVYDPVKNYLSPRPQFLRFDPNRRSQILKRSEEDSLYEFDSSLDSDGVKDGEESSAEENDVSSLTPQEASVLNQINGGMSEEVDVHEGEGEGEDAEEEEESGWCLSGVLKILLTLIACLLFTSYICSMNSPTNAPIQQISNLKDSGIEFRNGTLEYVSTRLDGDGFFEVGVGGIEEVQIYKENYGQIDESFEAEVVEYLEWHEKEMSGYENEDSEDMVDEAAKYEGAGAAQFDFEVDKLQELIDENAAVDEVAEYEGVGAAQFDFEVDNLQHLIDENAAVDEAAEYEGVGAAQFDFEVDNLQHLIDENAAVHEAAEYEGVGASQFDFEVDNLQHLIDENAADDEAAEYEGVGASLFDFEVDILQHLIDENASENLDDGSMFLDQEGDEIIDNGEVDSEPESSEQSIGVETVGWEDASESELEMEIDSSTQLQGPELTMKFLSEEVPTESKGADDTGSLNELVGLHGELSDSMDDEVDEIGDEAEVGMKKSEWNKSTIVGVFAVFILTLIAIIYRSQKSRRSSQRRVEFLSRASEVSEYVQKQKFAAESINTVVPVPSIEKRVEFLPRASLSSPSMREAPRDLANHMHAPIVELISEIDVGPSSHRRSGKYQMTISYNDFGATLSQNGSLPQLVTTPSRPSATEPHPTTSSTSYGSFTSERKISTKERGQSSEATTGTSPVTRSSIEQRGQSGEATMGTTPVRRSSRLRNRSAVMSP